MRAASMGAWIIRNLSWLIIIAIFVAGGAAKGERTAAFSGGWRHHMSRLDQRSKRHKARPNPVVRT